MRRAIVLLALISTIGLAMPARAAAGGTIDGSLVHVIDGDTADVRLGDRVERVRYIGIDAPEVAHHGVGGAPGGEAARRANAMLLAGRSVRLELDAEPRDRYGRLLAYVWVGDTLVNLAMVERGYAIALPIRPNARYAEWFARAELDARAAGRGLWSGGDDLASRDATRVVSIPRRHGIALRAPAAGPPTGSTLALGPRTATPRFTLRRWTPSDRRARPIFHPGLPPSPMRGASGPTVRTRTNEPTTR
jgi:micrococcal nuclease